MGLMEYTEFQIPNVLFLAQLRACSFSARSRVIPVVKLDAAGVYKITRLSVLKKTHSYLHLFHIQRTLVVQLPLELNPSVSTWRQ